jgi:hypothetical protein
MLDWFLPYLTPLNIAIYVLIHALTFHWAMRDNKKYLKAPKEAQQKYYAFRRTDADQWSWITMFPCKSSKH